MSRRAFLVLGAESTGTRFVAHILRAAGCRGHANPDGRYQQWDTNAPTTQSPIVWHRSFPHGDLFLPIRQIMTQIPHYDTQAIVCTRDWFAMSASQANFRPLEDVATNTQHAYSMIFSGLDEFLIPHLIVTYESLIYNYEPFTRRLLAYLNLPVPAILPPVHNGNKKYYAPPPPVT